MKPFLQIEDEQLKEFIILQREAILARLRQEKSARLEREKIASEASQAKQNMIDADDALIAKRSSDASSVNQAAIDRGYC